MPRVPLISIVDDDDAVRNSLDALIRSIGFRTQGFPSVVLPTIQQMLKFGQPFPSSA